MKARPVEAILFDLDETLCAYRRGTRELLLHAFRAVDVDPFFTVEDYHARIPDLVATADSKADLRTRAFAAIAEERGRPRETGAGVAKAYAAERDHANVEWVPGARTALKNLAEDYTLGLVTNGGPEMQEPKLDALALWNTFETVVYAGYDTNAKPDPEPYERAMEDLSVPADRTVFVGNSLETDIAGAKAAGVRSVWVPADTDIDRPRPEPDFALGDLKELVKRPWEQASRGPE